MLGDARPATDYEKAPCTWMTTVRGAFSYPYQHHQNHKGTIMSNLDNNINAPQTPDGYRHMGGFGSDNRAMPQYYPPAEPVNPEKNGFGLAAIILGVVGLLFAIIPITGFIAFILGVTGLCFGLAGIGRVRKNKATNKVASWAGTALSALALVVGIIGIVITFTAFNDLGNDLDCIGNASTSAEIDACN